MGLTSHLRIFLCMEPCDMRKSYNGLAALAANLVIGGLKSGALFPEGYEEQKDQLELIGQEITELLDYVPASLIKRRTIRPKFRRKDDRTLPPLVAPAPASPLPGGVPTFGLTAELIISKYADHLPLYRQQTILQRLGLHAPRDTLNHWTLQSLELLQPVTEAIHLECLAKSYLQLDDWSGATKTTNRSPQGTSGGEDHPPHQRTRPRHRKNAHRIRLGVQ